MAIGPHIEAETEKSLVPIDDLAVVVLFSVFEAVVRGYLAARLQPEANRCPIRFSSMRRTTLSRA